MSKIKLEPLSNFIEDSKMREEFINMTKFFYSPSVKTLEAVHASEYNDNWYDGYGFSHFIAKDDEGNVIPKNEFRDGYYCAELGFTIVSTTEIYNWDYLTRFHSPLKDNVEHQKKKKEKTIYIDLYS